MSGLLKKALTVVPRNKWKSTPLSLRATAGLRLLPDSVANNIIEEVINIIESTINTIEYIISVIDYVINLII